MLFPASEVVQDFMLHTIFASEAMVRKNPEAIRHFLKGWFETLAFIRSHEAETVEAQPAPISRKRSRIANTIS